MFKVHTNWTLTARKVEKEEQRHFQIHSSFSKFPKGFALNMGSFGAVYQRKGWSTKCEYDLFPNCRQNFLDLSFLKNIHGKIFATYCTWEVKITFKKVFRACLTFIWICSRTFGEHVFMWLHSTHHPYGPPSQATFIIHTILSDEIGSSSLFLSSSLCSSKQWSCNGKLELGIFHFWEKNIPGIFGHQLNGRISW